MPNAQAPAPPQLPGRSVLIALLVLAMAASCEPAEGRPRRQLGIVGMKAPAWKISRWFNLSRGSKQLDVSDYQGKVVYLFFFQSWCPGCHKRGFPALKKLVKHYSRNDDVKFVAVQTVFEGFAVNTAAAAKRTGDGFGLKIPVGHDDGPDEKRSYLMGRYRSGGTPWVVIIDRKGIVRFNAFHNQVADSIALIDQLL